MGPIEGEPLFCKSYDLTIFDPDWMTAGEYRILDGENLNRTDGVQPVQFTFSFSLTEN